MTDSVSYDREHNSIEILADEILIEEGSSEYDAADTNVYHSID